MRKSKAVIAVLLVIAMLIPMVLSTNAAQPPLGKLPVSRIDPTSLPEGELVYFGTVSATLPEKDALYELPVYREGDLSQKASVTIHTMDISALYGRDYSILNPEATGRSSEMTLLEKAVQPQAQLAELDEDRVSQALDKALDRPREEEQEPVSPLAQKKAEQTGLTTQMPASQEETEALTEALGDVLVPAAMQSLEHSAELTLTFAPGENVKFVTLRVCDDQESEGDESFSLNIVDTENVQVYQIGSASFILSDDEPVVHTEVSFDAPSYTARDGRAVVRVIRKNAVYAPVTLRIRSVGDTAVAGDNYLEVNEALSFVPYQTENEIVIPVSGSGDFELKLQDIQGGIEGDILRTTVHIREEETRDLRGSGKDTFTIQVDKKNYRVEAESNAYVGKILDTSYDPPLHVGNYFFPKPKTDSSGNLGFKYGIFGGDTPHVQVSNYVEGSPGYADLRYYKGACWFQGYSACETDYFLNTLYYQFLGADWMATSNGGSYREYRMESGTDSYTTFVYAHSPDADMRQVSTYGSVMDNKNSSLWKVHVRALDDSGSYCPKSYMNFYGVVAMFKKFQVSLGAPAPMSFLTGKGDAVMSSVPAQVKAKCGAQILGQQGSRDLFTSDNEQVSNMVFTLQDVTINGHSDKYGRLTGYKIKIDSPDAGKNPTAVTLSYPEDFISFLNMKTGRSTNAIDYSADAVSREIRKIQSHLDTVPYDKYFVDWINYNQKDTYTQGSGFYQKLVFTPVFDYNDVTVKVLAPYTEDETDKKGGGSFNNARLAAGKTLTYHAGDRLDLSATAQDPDGHRVDGYEVSTDGGATFDTIRNTQYLHLLPNTSYLIRPSIVANLNRIEIRFADSFARSNLAVQGLIPQEELKGTEYEGKNILCIDPKGRDIAAKMDPRVGSPYAIDLLVTGKPSSPDKVYLPQITDHMTGLTYTSQRYDMKARKAMGDNILTVSLLEVPKSQLKTFDLTGLLASSMAPILNDGLGVRPMPLPGYNMVAVQGQVPVKDANGNEVLRINSLNAGTEEDGTFIFRDFTGRPGDRITVTASNGVLEPQIFDVVLSDQGGKANAGTLHMTYPANMPRIVSLTHHYGSPENDLLEDLNSNSVCIYDDFLVLTAVVDAGDRIIKEIDFTVTTVTGQTSHYKGILSSVSDNGNVYTCKIPKMADSLYNGDRLSAALIDSKSHRLENSSNVIEIRYPTVETGLVFYVENKAMAPKHLDIGTTLPMDLPILGKSMPDISSGVLSFEKTPWANGTGFTYSLNLNETLFNSIPNATTEEKVKGFNGYKNAAKTVWEQEKQAKKAYQDTAEYIYSHMENDGLKTPEAKEEIARGEETAGRALQNSKDAKAKMDKGATWKLSAVFTMSLDFVLNPVRQEFVLAQVTVCVGGTFSANKTFYTSIYGVPCFLNIGGAVQVDLVVGSLLNEEELSASMTAGEFDKYAGNLKTKLQQHWLDVRLQFMGNLKLQVGCGMCGVLSARGYAALTVQADISLAGKEHGALFMGKGGLGFDLLLFSVDIDAVQAQVGLGTLKNATGYSFFGGLVSGKFSQNPQSRSAAVPVSVGDYDPGESSMEEFGTPSHTGIPTAVELNILKENAADRTRPIILDLGGGQKFILFMGSRGTPMPNAMCLYYSVCDTEGRWSTPRAVADDGTFDSTPTAVVRDGKVYIAWADAGRVLRKEENFKDKLNSLGISSAVYDAATDTMSREFTVVEDEFFNLAPSLNVLGDQIYCSYMKRDISQVTREGQLIDVAGSGFSTMASVSYNLTRGVREDEILIPILDEDLVSEGKEPLVLDYQSLITTQNGEDYFLTTYTVDKDANFQTNTDRELYLGITNMTEKKSYFPIRITRDEESQENPRLTNLNGKAYLTWLTGGTRFSIANVNLLLEALFDEELVGRVYADADPMDPNWYRKSANELNFHQKTDEEGLPLDYQGSVYDRLAHGDVVFPTADLAETDERTRSISNYSVTTDGSDIYIFYTDMGPDYDDTGTEIYGIRYLEPAFSRRDTQQIRNAASAEDPSAPYRGTFTSPVRITDYDMVIDEMDIIMREDSSLSAVSNYYSQTIGEDGHIHYGPNSLVEIEFQPRGSVVLREDSLRLDSRMIPGTPGQLSFTVENAGLLPASGYSAKVMARQNGKETVLHEENVEKLLDTGETREHTVPWTVPENTEGLEISVTVSELGTPLTETDTQTLKVLRESKLDIEEFRIDYSPRGITAQGVLRNIGSGKSAPLDLTLFNATDGKTRSTFSTGTLEALEPGAAASFSLPLPATAADFRLANSLDVGLTVTDGEKKAESFTDIRVPHPVLAELNGGSESVSVAKNGSVLLNAQAAPWNEAAGRAVFSTENGEIAQVDENGRVYGISKGTTTVSVLYPDSGVTDTIQVVVDQEPLPFTDVKSADWFYDDVAYVYYNNLMKGKSDTLFDPLAPLTRAQMAQILYNMEGAPAVTGTSPFTDVKENQWFHDPVVWAAGEGYVAGFGDGRFGPDKVLTREQMATIFHRYAGEPASRGSLEAFTDASGVSPYAVPALKWAVEQGLIRGKGQGLLDPLGTSRRAEVASLLRRFLQLEDS